MKTGFVKGNTYASSDIKSQARISKMKSINQEVVSNNEIQVIGMEIDLDGRIEPKHIVKDATQRGKQGIDSELETTNRNKLMV